MANQQFERTDRIASEIMRETEKIIREDVSDPRTDCMFSITHVDVTRDLRYAKVYVSVFPSNKAEAVMQMINENSRALRGELGRHVAKQLRIVPELVFFLDSTLDYVEHIDELLKK